MNEITLRNSPSDATGNFFILLKPEIHYIYPMGG